MALLSTSRLFRIYARNIELMAFKRGWSVDTLASRLGVSSHTITRIRRNRARYIDPEVLLAVLDVFGCTPNDLLLPQEGIKYDEED